MCQANGKVFAQKARYLHEYLIVWKMLVEEGEFFSPRPVQEFTTACPHESI
jgi:hypothetical protein